MMTVGELIRELEKYPDDSEVKVLDSHFDTLGDIADVTSRVPDFYDDNEDDEVVYIKFWAL